MFVPRNESDLLYTERLSLKEQHCPVPSRAGSLALAPPGEGLVLTLLRDVGQLLVLMVLSRTLPEEATSHNISHYYY